MYRPHTISDQQFSLQNKNLAAVYAVERDIIRLDERVKHRPCSSPIRTTLIRGDALGTLATEGVWIDIYTLMRVEAAASLLSKDKATDDAIKSLLSNEHHLGLDAAIQAYRYEQTVEWLTNPLNDIELKTPEDILNLYQHSGWGPIKGKREIDFRKDRVSRDNLDLNYVSYEVPAPEDIYFLLQDFCNFISSDTLTPITQASIAQFQFEALQPFDANLDRMERLIMYHILTRRKLSQDIAMPLNLFAGHFKGRFYSMLRSYLTASDKSSKDTLMYIEDITLHMVDVSYEILHLTVSMNNMISAFIDGWKSRFDRIERRSAVDLLLYKFAGSPVMTISQASKLIGKSFSTTSEAFARLEKAGIIRTGKPISRNKTFEAVDAIALHNGMYQKRALTYEEWSK